MALYDEEKENLDEILEEIKKAETVISKDNVTDVDSLIFAEIAGLDIEDLFGEAHNAFQWDEEKQRADYEIDSKRSYTVQKLIDAYRQKYMNKYREESNEEIRGWNTQKLIEHCIEKCNTQNAEWPSVGDVHKLRLLQALQESSRYRNILIRNFSKCEDQSYEENGKNYKTCYRGVTIDLNDAGNTHMIAYAGTGASLFSWIEDGRMAYSEDGIGAQILGAEYARAVMNTYGGNYLIAGYSKGGNQAIYTAVALAEEYKGQIVKVINVDGPGFNEKLLKKKLGESEEQKTFEQTLGELLNEGIIESTVTPYTSFVGKLMTDHSSYQYLEADNWPLFLNHDFKNWHIACEDGNPSFKRTDSQNASWSSNVLNRLVDGLLKRTSWEDKEHLMDVLENFCNFAEIHWIDDLNKLTETDEKGNWKACKQIIEFYDEKMSDEQKASINNILKEVLKDQNLKGFIIALFKDKWKHDRTDRPIGSSIECICNLMLGTVLVSMADGSANDVTFSEIVENMRVIQDFLDSVGGWNAFRSKGLIGKALSMANYYDSMDSDKKQQVRNLLKGLGKGLIHSSVEHPVLTPVLTGITIFALVVILWCTMKTKSPEELLEIMVATAIVVASIVKVRKRELYEKIEDIENAVAEAAEVLIDEINESLDGWLQSIQSISAQAVNWFSNPNIRNKLAKAAVEIVEATSRILPEAKGCVPAVVVHELRESYQNSHLHVELDFDQLEKITGKMSQAVTLSAFLERELDFFYERINRETVENTEQSIYIASGNTESSQTLSQKYHIRKSMLQANQYAILLQGSKRLEYAQQRLLALDTTLLC